MRLIPRLVMYNCVHCEPESGRQTIQQHPLFSKKKDDPRHWVGRDTKIRLIHIDLNCIHEEMPMPY